VFGGVRAAENLAANRKVALSRLSSLSLSLSDPFLTGARLAVAETKFFSLSTRARGRKATLGSLSLLPLLLAAVAGASAKNKSLLVAGGRCLHSHSLSLSSCVRLSSEFRFVAAGRALPLINRSRTRHLLILSSLTIWSVC